MGFIAFFLIWVNKLIMSNIINCPSCGAVNQLPEGKDSMFCAFCGSGIESKLIKTKAKKIKKCKIDSGLVSYADKSIKKLSQIISLYDDLEIRHIEQLFVGGTSITSMEDISSFSAYNYYFAYNGIQDFTEDDISELNELTMRYMKTEMVINFTNNPFVSLEWLRKFDYKKILSTYKDDGVNYIVYDNYVKSYDNVKLEMTISTIKDYNLDFLKDGNVDIISNDETTYITFFHPENKWSPKNLPKFKESLNSKSDETTEGIPKWVAFLFLIFAFAGVIVFLNGKVFLGILTILFFGGGGLFLYLKKD
jgi:hypothetical protein